MKRKGKVRFGSIKSDAKLRRQTKIDQALEQSLELTREF